MTSGNENERFEANVTEALQHRAGGLIVHQDLDHVLTQAAALPLPDHASATAESSLPRWAGHPLSAAAAVLIVGLVGVLAVSRLSGGDEELAVQEAIAEVFAADESATASRGGPSIERNEAILWLSVGASDEEVESLREWLNRNDAILSFRYVDRAATYAEFTEYFADEPEIIELVEPDQLPTSFVVTPQSRDAATSAAEIFTFIELVEFGEEP